ncbi:unnamed protein product [Acanthosepion pharaonis]|uniref:Uncharacterized protein n=1 Tax=Acanthosepion pharaonis TaxID=158019 RepID=A0A812CQ46_ACAPH|nr:unnamed protein product [Sepia pharaonis]
MPMGIVATLYPLPTAINTLLRQKLSVPHTDGYSGFTLYPLQTAITHFMTEAVSVPPFDGYSGYSSFPLPTAITPFATEAVSVHLIPMGYGGYSLSVTDSRNYTLRQKLSVPHTDGYSGCSFIPLQTAITHFATEAVSVIHTDGYRLLFIPLQTAITHFATEGCQFLIPMGIVATLYPVTDGHKYRDRSDRPMGVARYLTQFATDGVYRGYSGYSFLRYRQPQHTLRQKLSVPHTDGYSGYFILLPTAITHFATEAVSVPHTDGYSGYSLSVTDSHNLFATEAVSVPHTDGYSGYSLSVTNRPYNTLRQKLCRTSPMVWWHSLSPLQTRFATEAVSVPSFGAINLFIFAMHFPTKLCRYLIPMGIVATLYPLPTAITHFATSCVSSSYRWTAITHFLRQKLCQYLIPMGIVATLCPVTDSHNTLCDQKLCRPHTDGYSGCTHPVTTAITRQKLCQYLPPMGIG